MTIRARKSPAVRPGQPTTDPLKIIRSYTIHIRQTDDGLVRVMLSKLDLTRRQYRFAPPLVSYYGWLTTSSNADLLRVAALMIEADAEANEF